MPGPAPAAAKALRSLLSADRYLMAGRGGRVIAPQCLGEPVHRHHAAVLHQQRGEQHPFPAAHRGSRVRPPASPGAGPGHGKPAERAFSLQRRPSLARRLGRCSARDGEPLPHHLDRPGRPAGYRTDNNWIRRWSVLGYVKILLLDPGGHRRGRVRRGVRVHRRHQQHLGEHPRGARSWPIRILVPGVPGFTCSFLTVPARSQRARPWHAAAPGRGREQYQRAARRAAVPDRRPRPARASRSSRGSPRASRRCSPPTGCVMFDQRGTGQFGAINCPALQKAGGQLRYHRAAASGGGRSAPTSSGRTGASTSTMDTVADIDMLRRALGARTMVLDGVSYGTYVAERYALAHPGARVQAGPRFDPAAGGSRAGRTRSTWWAARGRPGAAGGLPGQAGLRLRPGQGRGLAGPPPGRRRAHLRHPGHLRVHRPDLPRPEPARRAAGDSGTSSARCTPRGTATPRTSTSSSAGSARRAAPRRSSAQGCTRRRSAPTCVSRGDPMPCHRPGRGPALGRGHRQADQAAGLPVRRQDRGGRRHHANLPGLAGHPARAGRVRWVDAAGPRVAAGRRPRPVHPAGMGAGRRPRTRRSGKLVIVHGASHSIQSRERGDQGRKAVFAFLLG